MTGSVLEDFRKEEIVKWLEKRVDANSMNIAKHETEIGNMDQAIVGIHKDISTRSIGVSKRFDHLSQLIGSITERVLRKKQVTDLRRDNAALFKTLWSLQQAPVPPPSSDVVDPLLEKNRLLCAETFNLNSKIQELEGRIAKASKLVSTGKGEQDVHFCKEIYRILNPAIERKTDAVQASTPQVSEPEVLQHEDESDGEPQQQHDESHNSMP